MTEHNYLSDQPEKQFIVYKTTNLVNNRFYIGVHAQSVDPMIFDGYFGSGVAIRKAVEKYGEDQFTRETLFIFDDAQSAYDKEAEIVNDAFLLENDGICYNMKHGGIGAICVEGDRNPMFGKTGNQHPRFGTTHTDDTKSKMSEKAKLRCEDEEWMNAMIADRSDRIGINKDGVYKVVRPEDLDDNLNSGWSLGEPVGHKSKMAQTVKNKHTVKFCTIFGVETEEQLRDKISNLYHTQNLNLTEISDMFNLTVMQIKGIRDKLGIPKKSREQWLSTRSDKK